MKRLILILGLFLVARSVSAQALTGATLRIYPTSGAVLSTTTLPASSFTCGQPLPVPQPTSSVAWDDFTKVGMVCLYKDPGTGPIATLAAGSYQVTVAQTNAGGTSAESTKVAFTKGSTTPPQPTPPPPAPTNVKIAPGTATTTPPSPTTDLVAPTAQTFTDANGGVWGFPATPLAPGSPCYSFLRNGTVSAGGIVGTELYLKNGVANGFACDKNWYSLANPSAPTLIGPTKP